MILQRHILIYTYHISTYMIRWHTNFSVFVFTKYNANFTLSHVHVLSRFHHQMILKIMPSCTRVAWWYICIPKIPVGVWFGCSWNGTRYIHSSFYAHFKYFVAVWYILWQIFYDKYFVAIWCISLLLRTYCAHLVYFFPFWYVVSKKNLATLWCAITDSSFW
jgi:hypothetical protein